VCYIYRCAIFARLKDVFCWCSRMCLLFFSQWNVSSPAPDLLPLECVWFGLITDPQKSTVTLDLGPFGGTQEVRSLFYLRN
jgi:hypothetical protein